MKTLLIAASLSMLLPVSNFAQVTMTAPPPQAPPRDPSITAVKGTGAIKGKVTAADGGRPLRRVQISLSSPDLGETRR